MKKLFFFININFKKKVYLYIVIFFYLTVVLVNFFNNNYKVDSNPVNFKLNISKELSIIEKYDLYPDRECKITGDMHDRHKVRWVKNYSLEKIYQFFYNLNNISPYYINIFLHSFLIFLTFFAKLLKIIWVYFFVLYIQMSFPFLIFNENYNFI